MIIFFCYLFEIENYIKIQKFYSLKKIKFNFYLFLVFNCIFMASTFFKIGSKDLENSNDLQIYLGNMTGSIFLIMMLFFIPIVNGVILVCNMINFSNTLIYINLFYLFHFILF